MTTQQAVMTGKEKACKICGKVCKHQGALNIHVYHCKIKHGQFDPVQKTMDQATCEHSWRLLGGRNREEYLAMKQGYTEVCTKCHEVQK